MHHVARALFKFYYISPPGYLLLLGAVKEGFDLECTFICPFKPLGFKNEQEHEPHLYGLSFLCAFMWTCSSYFVEKRVLHKSHRNLLVCVRRWRCRLRLVWNCLEHIGHLWLWDSQCFNSCFLDGKRLEHLLHSTQWERTTWDATSLREENPSGQRLQRNFRDGLQVFLCLFVL